MFEQSKSEGIDGYNVFAAAAAAAAAADTSAAAKNLPNDKEISRNAVSICPGKSTFAWEEREIKEREIFFLKKSTRLAKIQTDDTLIVFGA